jgi:uncharacterized sporulation protein YeaH/YhbH (DUF444 family)
MPNFIDRRLNPKDKSLGNRQRFMRRAHSQIKEVVNRALKDRNITDVTSGETVTIPTKGIGEPHFQNAPGTGKRQHVLVGNREFVVGDKIKKPPSSGGGRGKEAADQGDGEDSFQFYLTRDEFLDIFFEDLELPDLVKTTLKEVHTYKMRRAGLTSTGTPTNINILRTARQSYGRRLALKRPRSAEVAALEAEIARLEDLPEDDSERQSKLAVLLEELESLRARQKAVPYLDPIDLRYNNLQPQPSPNANAVMFCLMDVSGSMGEREKDLAKRFFMLLHLFLKRRYDRIDVVFIRHAHEAQEVDEESFFYSRETGGTVVSTALVEMLKVVRARYPTSDWNIYAAQASDGDNFSGDSERCVAMLNESIMPLCQYYAYVEILDEREFEIFQDTMNGAALWRAYQTVAGHWPNFAMKRIARPADIYPVFRELFAKQPVSG